MRKCTSCNEDADVDLLWLSGNSLRFMPCCAPHANQFRRKPRNKPRYVFLLRESADIAQVTNELEKTA